MSMARCLGSLAMCAIGLLAVLSTGSVPMALLGGRISPFTPLLSNHEWALDGQPLAFWVATALRALIAGLAWFALALIRQQQEGRQEGR